MYNNISTWYKQTTYRYFYFDHTIYIFFKTKVVYN